MSLSNHSNSPNLTDASALPVSVVNQPSQQPTSNHQPLSARELRRFLERRRAQELGYEMPLNTGEAASYVGYHKKTVERTARDGEIPAHPASGVRRKTWKFYASELDAWLRGKVISSRHPCSPNGKETIQ
jgi:excisionase family DNA binding protein